VLTVKHTGADKEIWHQLISGVNGPGYLQEGHDASNKYKKTPKVHYTTASK
jgi:hypothetical protein